MICRSISLPCAFAWAIILIAGMTPLAMAQVPPPAAERSVQCGSFATQAEADVCKTRLAALGYGPVWQVEESSRIRVQVGRCERLVDAIILNDSLKKNGFPDAFTRAFKNTEGREFSTIVQKPKAPLLNLDAPPQFVLATGLSDFSGRQELAALLSAAGEDRDDARVIAEGTVLISTLADSDPAKGRAMNEVAHSMVRLEKKALPALPYMLKVARGEVAATEADRREACWMAADSWHYYVPDRLKAYQAYCEILDKWGEEPGIRVRAKVEIAASLLEFARSGKGYYNEVRRACRQITELEPPEYRRAHAVADLMFCESLDVRGRTGKIS